MTKRTSIFMASALVAGLGINDAADAAQSGWIPATKVSSFMKKHVEGKGELTGIDCRFNKKPTNNIMQGTDVNITYSPTRKGTTSLFRDYNRWAVGVEGFISKFDAKAKSAGLTSRGSDSFSFPYKEGGVAKIGKVFCKVWSRDPVGPKV